MTGKITQDILLFFTLCCSICHEGGAIQIILIPDKITKLIANSIRIDAYFKSGIAQTSVEWGFLDNSNRSQVLVTSYCKLSAIVTGIEGLVATLRSDDNGCRVGTSNIDIPDPKDFYKGNIRFSLRNTSLNSTFSRDIPVMIEPDPVVYPDGGYGGPTVPGVSISKTNMALRFILIFGISAISIVDIYLSATLTKRIGCWICCKCQLGPKSCLGFKKFFGTVWESIITCLMAFRISSQTDNKGISSHISGALINGVESFQYNVKGKNTSSKRASLRDKNQESSLSSYHTAPSGPKQGTNSTLFDFVIERAPSSPKQIQEKKVLQQSLTKTNRNTNSENGIISSQRDSFMKESRKQLQLAETRNFKDSDSNIAKFSEVEKENYENCDLSILSNQSKKTLEESKCSRPSSPIKTSQTSAETSKQSRNTLGEIFNSRPSTPKKIEGTESRSSSPTIQASTETSNPSKKSTDETISPPSSPVKSSQTSSMTKKQSRLTFNEAKGRRSSSPAKSLQTSTETTKQSRKSLDQTTSVKSRPSSPTKVERRLFRKDSKKVASSHVTNADISSFFESTGSVTVPNPNVTNLSNQSKDKDPDDNSCEETAV